MIDFIIASIALTIGLVFLAISADKFVDISATIAYKLKLSTFIIGFVIIGFGTSLPEIFVSALASIGGNPGIAIGNAYGSNIANIALILGISSIFNPIIFKSLILKKQLFFLAIITIVSFFLIIDLKISYVDALILILLFIVIFFINIKEGLSKRDNTLDTKENQLKLNIGFPLKKCYLLSIFCLAVLLISSRVFIWGAINIAKYFEVNDTVIGLTIVALGTSLPELAAAISASRKGKNDMVIGNILGSNLFNTTLVVGIAGIIHPFSFLKEILMRDMFLIFVLTGLLFIIGCNFKQRSLRKITRFEGAGLLVIYLLYLASFIFKLIK